MLLAVELGGVNCTEFDDQIYGLALNDTLPDASFDEHSCVSAGTDGDVSLVSITTELTVPRLDSDKSAQASVDARVSAAVSDGSFQGAIIARAGRRRLGMLDISVRGASVATFSPTRAPSPSPPAHHGHWSIASRLGKARSRACDSARTCCHGRAGPEMMPTAAVTWRRRHQA